MSEEGLPISSSDEASTVKRRLRDRGQQVLRGQISVWDLVLISAVLSVLAVSGLASIRDVDLYWHVVIGDQLLSSWWPATYDPISYTDAQAWYPGAWATEVVYAEVVRIAGFAGIAWLRFLLVGIFLTSLALMLRRRSSPWAAFLVFSAAAIPLFDAYQDRPQLVSLVLLVPLAAALQRALEGATPPSIWVIALYTWVWANVHGLWIMVPAICVLIAVSSQIGSQRGRASPYPWLIRGLVAWVAAGLTPFTFHVWLTPFSIASAASEIAEWQPLSVAVPSAWALVFLAIIYLVTVARSKSRVPGNELLVVVALLLFGALLTRNAAVAAVLVAGIVAARVDHTFGHFRAQITVPAVIVPVVSALLLVTAATNYARESAIPERLPIAVADSLAAREGTTRVLSAYGLSGFLRQFGGDGVRVAIDGRTDRYGAETIGRHFDFQMGLPGWEKYLQSTDPDVIVLGEDMPVVQLLVQSGDWTISDQDGSVVVLEPATPG